MIRVFVENAAIDESPWEDWVDDTSRHYVWSIDNGCLQIHCGPARTGFYTRSELEVIKTYAQGAWRYVERLDD